MVTTSDDRTAQLARSAAVSAEADARLAMLPKIRAEGRAALVRLMPIAQGDSDQSAVVARFLLGLYDGKRYPFDLTDFRRLDGLVFDDCLAVLQMDWQPAAEVHTYFTDGRRIFEALAVARAAETP